MHSIRTSLLALGVIAIVQMLQVEAKIFDRCEFAQTLLSFEPNINYGNLNKWVCIAHQAHFNSIRIFHNKDDQSDVLYGLFQLSNRTACASDRNLFAKRTCAIFCNKLLDGKLDDDYNCARKVFDVEASESGDGFNAFQTYRINCVEAKDFLNDCHTEATVFVDLNVRDLLHTIDPRSTRKYTRSVSDKTYDRCELFRELEQSRDMSWDKAAVWTCLAINELNARKRGEPVQQNVLNRNDIQLRDIYPCAATDVIPVCFVTCYELKQLNDMDFMDCMQKVYSAERGISGDGFNAFKSGPYCRGQTNKYSEGCYTIQDESDNVVNETDDNNLAESRIQAVQLGKVYELCELAQELRFVHQFDVSEINSLVCIVEHESNFSTSAVGELNKDGSKDHGLFQISDKWWCSTNASSSGNGCNTNCTSLEDADISDDVVCVKKIFKEQRKISGEGLDAWVSFRPYCFLKSIEYTRHCFNDTDLKIFEKNFTSVARLSEDLPEVKGRNFTACELADDLLNVHQISEEKLDTWLCIIEASSNFSTSSVSQQHPDGSREHGLFHINDKYWCSPSSGQDYDECEVPCSKLRDIDIAASVQCAMKIYSKQGFPSWQSYNLKCKTNPRAYSQECFDNKERRPEHIKLAAKMEPSPRVTGKIYTATELATELQEIYKFPENEADIWVCIAMRESGLNTSAVGVGSHGIFKIGEQFWCSNTDEPGKACSARCSSFEDSDISDDVSCIKKIFAEQKSISGDGFNSWSSYSFCKKKVDPAINELVENQQDNNLIVNKMGKIYERCELAKELRDVHKIPTEQIGIWTCIMERSDYNTSFLGPLNSDGNRNRGILQINDAWWCGRNLEAGGICNVDCSKLVDDNIADDLICGQKIVSETMGRTGDGFTAWPIYLEKCKEKSLEFINGCGFDSIATDLASDMQISIKGKVYELCELAQELLYVHKIDKGEINTWACIIENESKFNTSTVSEAHADGSREHGIFRFSDNYWCSANGMAGKGCNTTCDKFEDSEISDDISCARKIHEAEGFNAWPSYGSRCRFRTENYTRDCFRNEEGVTDSPAVQKQLDSSATQIVRPPVGKIYERCELARELRDVHKISIKEIGIWVCIMDKAGYNTSLQGPLNTDGNRNRGILQINDAWWCGRNQEAGGICNVDCSKLVDDNIADDLICGQKIVSETMGRTGDGFSAWPIYTVKCKEKAPEYIEGCGIDPNAIQITTTSTEATTTIRTKTEILDSGGIVFESCDMARELLKNDISLIDLDIWMCIIERESNFNTSSISRLQFDGSREHGLFKVSNNFWCSPPGKGKGCNLDCAKLMDADISDDVKCAKTIFDIHGFAAWGSYNRWCKGSRKAYSRGCNLVPIETGVQSNSAVLGKGKVFELCELAQDLLYVHNIPKQDINTWVCIMEGESNFNTSSVSELHADGSREHGILQISDRKWCSPANAGMGCGVSCDKLEDSNIADDIECGLKIQKMAGFSEWSSYGARCRFRTETYTRDCFRPQEGVTDSPEATTMKTVKPTGKIYEKCEFARELRYVHRFPADQINTFVCIVENESNFNTSAVGTLNKDGTKDHGIFQISDKYWCGDGKLCGISCTDLEDSDIFDDILCARNIFAAEQRRSANGFKAWATYDINNCGRKTLEYTSYCFDGLDERGMPATTESASTEPTLPEIEPSPIVAPETVVQDASLLPPSSPPVVAMPPRTVVPSINAPIPPNNAQDASLLSQSSPPMVASPPKTIVSSISAPIPPDNAQVPNIPNANQQFVPSILQWAQSVATSNDSASLGRINLNFNYIYNFFFPNQSVNTFNFN